MSEQRTITIRVPVEMAATTKETGTTFLTGFCPRFGAVVADGQAALVRSEDVGRAVLAAWPSEPATDYAKRLAEIGARLTNKDWLRPEANPVRWARQLAEDATMLLAQHRAASEALTAAGIPDDGRPLVERVESLAAAVDEACDAIGQHTKGQPLPKRIADIGRMLRIAMSQAHDRGAERAHDALVSADARRDADVLKRAVRAAVITLGAQVPEDAGPETLASALRDIVDAAQAALRAAKVLAEDGTLGDAANDILRAAGLIKRITLGTTVEHDCEDPAKCLLCQVPTEEESAAIVDRLQGDERVDIEAIRATHEAVGADDAVALSLAHADRGALLREIDRLRALVPHESPLPDWPEPTDEEMAAGHALLRGMGSKAASVAKLAAIDPSLVEPSCPRPETGPMRFGDDWAGVFLRGDYAGPMAMALGRFIDGTPGTGQIDIVQLRDLASVLADALRTAPAGLQQMRPFGECVKPTDQRAAAWSLNDRECRLDNLAALAENWDSYGAKPVAPESIATMRSVVAELHAQGAPKPHVYPTPDGGVQCEWRGIDGEIKTLGNKIEAWATRDLQASSDQIMITGPVEEAVGITRAFLAAVGSNKTDDRWLDPDVPQSEVDAALHAEGVDPKELADRGAAFVAGLKAKAMAREEGDDFDDLNRVDLGDVEADDKAMDAARKHGPKCSGRRCRGGGPLCEGHLAAAVPVDGKEGATS